MSVWGQTRYDELSLLYSILTGIVLMPYLGWSILFWMVVYMLGFFYIAGLNLIQHAPQTSHQPSESGATD